MGATSPFLARIFRAFRYRDFRLMWVGACASTIGTFVQQFAQSWLVYDLTKDPFYLGLDLFLGQLPIIMFSLFGGVFADRLDRRKMLLTSQYIQMACAFLLAFLFFTHVVRVWHILALSFIVGLGQSFGGPAYSALLPTLVGPEDLANAIAMNSIQFNLARIIGPTIGGFTYTLLGATWCFTLNGVSYLAVIASLFMIKVKFVPSKSREPVLTSMAEGIRFIRCRKWDERPGGVGVLHHVIRILAHRVLARFRTEHLSQRSRNLHPAPGFLRAGSICRRSDRGSHGKVQGSAAPYGADPYLFGIRHRRLCSFQVASTLLPAHLLHRGRGHGFRLTDAFAGSADCYRRHARTSHERVQPGLSCRYSSG